MTKRHLHTWHLIRHLEAGTVPEEWENALERVEQDAAHLDRLLDQPEPPKIYGVNTLVGHLDNVTVSEAEVEGFQNDLLDNHSIGTGESYSSYEVTAITYAKMHAFSLGGSGITPALYTHLVELVKQQRIPVEVPKSSSYSAGDVIPAAHWAKQMTTHLHDAYHYQLQRKEGLSLINGSFVHVGVALAKLRDIQSVWTLYNENSLQYARILNNQQNESSPHMLLEEADSMHLPLRWLREMDTENRNYQVQAPVSVRAYPQVASAMLNSVNGYLDAVEEQLLRRSDNPIVLAEETYPMSQGSFLAPMISLATSQLTEALLLAMWQIERRVQFLLSGDIHGLPLNLAMKDDKLGYIQVPKLVSAKLEESRMKAGRRTFASGSATSYGIEDLWTNGLFALDILEDLMHNMNTMLAMEMALLLHVSQQFLEDEKLNAAFHSYQQIDSFRKQYMKLMADNSEQQLPIDYQIEPFSY